MDHETLLFETVRGAERPVITLVLLVSLLVVLGNLALVTMFVRSRTRQWS